jgi:hypothetical protein
MPASLLVVKGSFGFKNKTLIGKDGRFCYIICRKPFTTQEVPLGRCPGLGEPMPLRGKGTRHIIILATFHNDFRREAFVFIY